MFACVFPGQGSHFVGMGKDVYETFSVARDVFHEVDEALQQKLSHLIFNGPETDLTLTINTQPALMAVSLAILKVLTSQGDFDLKAKVACVAGHSLGEYSALTAAHVLSLTDTARLLRTRGEAMQAAVPLGKGSMAAILGLDADVLQEIIHGLKAPDVCEIANDNAPGQIVISGYKESVAKVMEQALAKGAKRCVELAVSAPFHSSLMKPAADIMDGALKAVPFYEPLVPVVPNRIAELETDPHRLRELLVKQVTGQVRWRESVTKMASMGVSTFIEIGAGKVLTGLTKRIAPDVTTLSIGSVEDIESFLNTL